MSHCGERGPGGKGREEGTKSLFIIPARGYTQFYVPRWVVKCALPAPESYDKSLCYHNTTFLGKNQVVLHSYAARFALCARMIPVQGQVSYDSRTEGNTDEFLYIALSVLLSARESKIRLRLSRATLFVSCDKSGEGGRRTAEQPAQDARVAPKPVALVIVEHF